jgi:uncharacterized membrane protein
MSKILNTSIIALALAALMISCGGQPSVHRYYVEHENMAGFSSYILPSNLISFKDGEDIDEETLQALNDLNSLYVLRYQEEEDPSESGLAYYEDLRSCVDNGYKELVHMVTSEQEVQVVMDERSGEISEIVALIKQDDGFLMARVTGKIHLDELMKVMNKIDMNKLLTESNIDQSWI